MRLVWATVGSVEDVSDSLQRLGVEVDEGSSAQALCYTALAGACEAGDRVLLNTTAVELGLGTGGSHFVVARVGGQPHGVSVNAPSGGHIMKLRYSPLQLDVLSVESPESPHHSTMQTATRLSGLPVVCCGLHSHVPLVAAAIKHRAPSARVVYCMTDQAALALPLSDVVRHSADVGLLDDTISCGQAFGGAYEAVNLHSGLLAARHVCEADVAIVAIGPGVVGTATPFGHGGVAQGEAINAVAALGGRPVACVRMSFADARPRHQGVSHHTMSALTAIALAPARVALPHLPDEFSDAIADQLERAGVWRLHEAAWVGEHSACEPSLRGVNVRSMGRGPADDPAFFESAYAAGEIAFRLASSVL